MSTALITGYVDRLSVQPGDTLRFMVSAEGVAEAEVAIVRLVHGDENPAGPGFIEREVARPLAGPIKPMRQYSQLGSYVEIPDPENRMLPDGSFTVHAFIWPTLPAKGRQGILTQYSAADRRGFALGIDEAGRLALWLGDGTNLAEVAADRPLATRDWYFVAASYDAATQSVTLYQEPVLNSYNSRLSPIAPRDDSSHVTATVKCAPARLEVLGLAVDHAPGQRGVELRQATAGLGRQPRQRGLQRQPLGLTLGLLGLETSGIEQRQRLALGDLLALAHHQFAQDAALEAGDHLLAALGHHARRRLGHDVDLRHRGRADGGGDRREHQVHRPHGRRRGLHDRFGPFLRRSGPALCQRTG